MNPLFVTIAMKIQFLEQGGSAWSVTVTIFALHVTMVANIICVIPSLALICTGEQGENSCK